MITIYLSYCRQVDEKETVFMKCPVFSFGYLVSRISVVVLVESSVSNILWCQATCIQYIRYLVSSTSRLIIFISCVVYGILYICITLVSGNYSILKYPVSGTNGILVYVYLVGMFSIWHNGKRDKCIWYIC